MNITDVKTVDDLAEFMEAEAALWGRVDSNQKFTNGTGIRGQWHERLNFPYAVCYMLGREADENDLATDPVPRTNGVPKVIFELKAMYFDIDGNKTEKPKRNQDVLYHND